MNILIPTYIEDVHALAIANGLTRCGHEPLLWFGADFPNKMEASFFVSMESFGLYEFGGPNLSLDEAKNCIDVVWFRRPTPPVLSPDVHPHDIEFANNEATIFYNSIWLNIADSAFWVNQFINSRVANSKIYQLRLAKTIGFTIPKTLISNSPCKIREFAQKNSPVIYKPFSQRFWQTKESKYAVWASPLEVDILKDDFSLQATPGIYQEKIDKSYELRLTFMGSHCVAIKLDSQQLESAKNDWRAHVMDVDIEEYQLPKPIYELCQSFMNSAFLNFAIFDMIVTKEGKYVFLEVNEMGQFLWIEERLPDIRMMDMFCQFLISKDRKFKYIPSEKKLSFVDYLQTSHQIDSTFLKSYHNHYEINSETEET